MAFNLVDSFKSLLTLEVVDKAAAQFGENQANISKAISGAVPVLLAGFVHSAETGNADSLLQDSKEAASNNLSNFSEGGSVRSKGMDWLSSLFGDRQGAIGDTLASFSGIKNSSAHSLLAMLAPAGLAVIGKHALDNNLSVDGFRSFLSGQKSNIKSALPAGFNVGLDNWLDRDNRAGTSATTAAQTAATHHHAATTEHHVVRDKPRSTNWLLILILLLAIIALAWYFLFRDSSSANMETATSDTTDTVTTTPAMPADTSVQANAMNTARDSIKVRLANNTEINAYRGGIEDRLVNCLNDSACKAGANQWFDFDNINFETGSAQLTASSQAQINNIVAIMKAYPNAKIKIGGYTDKTGDDAANEKLSQDRAEAVLNALKAGGVPESQLAGAEGYGSEFAKVPATASDEERRVDRRIAVQLREK